MKKIILLFVFFIAAQSFAQTNGISYQAIIMNPKGEQLPGVNNANSPVVNKNICMVFKFVDEFSNIEYQETVQTQTDGFGMVNLVIGKGTQTAGYAASFQSIVWSSSKKSLIVGINTNGNCATYTEISNQEFSYAPLAFSAITAENVTGVVAIENGGTNATTVSGARTNLQINNVDNTSDLNKPISIATQTALNLKENTANKSIDILVDANSDTKYPSVKSVKMYVDGKLLTSSNALDAEINRATMAENTIAANLVTEINNRTAANNTLTTNLATEATNRTAADLLKEDLANKSTNVTTDGASDTKYPSVKSVKTYVDASATSSSTALTNEITRATIAENIIAADLATETSARTLADATLISNLSNEANARTVADLLKEDVANKSTNVTTDGASDTKYPSVKSVKTYVDASAASSSTALTNEMTRATIAENTIAADLATETSARTSADATLTTNLATEITRATIAENTIAADLATETSARTLADATLTSNLSNEANTRTVADLLKEDVANKSTNVTTDGTSDTKYPSVKSVKTYVDASAVLSSTALANEVTRATTAENTIATNLTAETTARTSADATLTTNLATEVTRATAAENTIATNLTTETAARTSAEATLQTNINAVQAGVDANETAVNTALNLKAPLASPTFTGTVSGITKTMVGLGNVDNTADLLKPVSTAAQTALDLKVDKVTGKGLSTEDYTSTEKTKLAAITGTNTGDQDISGIAANTNKIGDLTSLTTTAQSSLVAAVNEIEAGKAPLASPTFTGTVSGITKTMVGLGNVDNTTDLLKPVSTATQTALDLKVDKVSGERLINASEITKLSNQSGTNTGDQDISGIVVNATKIGDLTGLTTTAKSNLVAAINENGAGIATNTNKIGDLTSLTTTAQSSLVAAVNEIGTGIAANTTKIGDLANLTTTAKSSLVAAVNEIQAAKASLASPTFTGTVSGIDKTMVGLANVDNTSDANKPVSTATQTALDLKAPLASPTFTGTVTASGTVTANSLVKSGGTSSQFLKADGSVDSSTYLTSAATTLDGLTDAKVGGTNFSNSILLGHQTTGTLTTADRNIGIGVGSISNITTGDDNIAIGYQALNANTTSNENIAIGRQAMSGNSSGSSNTAIGLQALEANSSGHHNATYGYLSMVNNSTGSQNAAFGQEAMQGNDTGNKNVSIGGETLYNNSQGSNNIAIGFGAAGSNTTGTNNTIIGYVADVSSSALTNATAIGNGAVVNASNKIQLGNTSVTLVNTSGAITATGAITSNAAVTGSSIVKAGGTSTQFLKADGSVDSSTYLTTTTGLPLTGGTLSGGLTGTTMTGTTITGTSIVKSGGTSSQFLKADGSVDSSTYLTSATTTLDGLTDSKSGGANFSNSLLIGHQTTGVLSSADRNIGIGIGALTSITSGDDNIAIGYQALVSNTTGLQNISIGRQSMLGNVTGSSNTAVGLETLESNSTGHHNAAFGHLTMISNSTGYQNAAYGQEALQGNTTGNKNTAMGAESLYNNSQGNFNIAVGFGAMGSNTTGSNNTAVGYNADVSSSTLTNATAIGNGAIVTASNKIQLGNGSVTSVNTSGQLTTGTVTYPNTNGTSGQVLTTNGAGTASWQSTPSMMYSFMSKTSDYTITAGDATNNLIVKNSSNSVVTFTLPSASAAGVGKMIYITSTSTSTPQSINVLTDGSDLFFGFYTTPSGTTDISSTTLSNISWVQLISDGTSWNILGMYW